VAAKYYQRGEADAVAALAYERADPNLQAQAIDLYGALIDATDRSKDAFEWGQLHNNRAAARERLAAVRQDQAAFEASAEDLNAALTVFTRQAYPAEWAAATANLASIDDLIGQATHDLGRQRKGVDLLRTILATKSRTDEPDAWAVLQFNIGSALTKIGKSSDDKVALAEGADALLAAAAVWKGTVHVMEWGMAQYSLGDNLIAQGRAAEAVSTLQSALAGGNLTDPVALQTLLVLGHAQQLLVGDARDRAAFEPAIATFRRAIALNDPTAVGRAKAQTGLGYSLMMQGIAASDAALIRQAVEQFAAALTVRTPDGVIADWTESTVDLGLAQLELGVIGLSQADVETAQKTFSSARQIREAKGLPPDDGISRASELADKVHAVLSQAANP
jgi:tetratricopeptide (TPR) repeat protein